MRSSSPYNEITPKIRYSFLFLDLAFLTTGAFLIAMASIWWMEFGDDLKSIVVTRRILLSAMVLGCIIVLSTFVGLIGFSNPIKRKTWLSTHAFLIVISASLMLLLGAVLWFETLEERSTYGQEWQEWPDTLKATFQDQLHCCGWLNSTDMVASSNTCPLDQQPLNIQGCVGPMTKQIAHLSQELFTTLFGFIGIDTFTFLATIVLIQAARVEERYRKIDEKNGGNDRALRRQYV